MLIDITGRHLEITQALKDAAAQKLKPLERHFTRIKIDRIHLVFHVENLTQCVDATLHVTGKEISASAQSEDMYQSLDLLVEKLEKQLMKHKDKLTDH